STLKSPSYTKSVSWQHYRLRNMRNIKNNIRHNDLGVTTKRQ
ncbi:transposase, partial [Shigella dysenteriae]